MKVKNVGGLLRPAGTAAVQLYAPTSGMKTRVNKLSVSNPGASTYNYSVHMVPSGGAADSSNELAPDTDMAPNDRETISEAIGQILINGASLYVRSSAADQLVFFYSLTEFVD